MHLIHLTHCSLALPTLNVFRTVSLAYSWAKSNTNLFYNKVSTVSRNLLNAVLKWQAEWLSGSRLVASVSVVYPRELGPEAPCPVSRERVGQHVTNPGNDQNAEFEVRFLLDANHVLAMLKSKNRKWKYH